jgi:small-conductance mechanosensitive channel
MTNKTDLPDPPLAERLPQLWTDSIGWVANHSTQIALASLLGGIIVALLIAAKWFGKRLCERDPLNNHWQSIIGSALATTRLWFMLAVAAQIVARYAHAPADIAQTIQFVFVIATTLQAAIFARALIIGLIEHRAQSSDEEAALASAMGIIRLLVTFALFAIAIILILSNLGVNVTGLVAGLGIGGIAIGLAAQGIFADLFAALAILFDRPFRKGDSIRYDTTSGNIEDIGLKSTRIRALTGEQIIIANKQLLEKEIHNLARLDRRRIVTTLGVTYQTSIDLIDQLPDILKSVVEGCDKATLVRAGFVKFSDSSLDIELQYDVHSEIYDVVFDTQHRVNVTILRRFAELGIEFAYPTQTSFTAAPDGKFILPYAEPSKPDVVQT